MSLLKRLAKSLFGEPVAQKSHLREFCQQHYKNQFKRMTPEERWVRASLLENAERTPVNEKTRKRKREEDDEETIFSCVKCGSKYVDVYQLQTRGADEATSSFFTCKKCRHRWCEN